MIEAIQIKIIALYLDFWYLSLKINVYKRLLYKILNKIFVYDVSFRWQIHKTKYICRNHFVRRSNTSVTSLTHYVNHLYLTKQPEAADGLNNAM